MIATVTLLGSVVATSFHSDPYDALGWLITQRNIWGSDPTFRIESIDGFVIHTL